MRPGSLREGASSARRGLLETFAAATEQASGMVSTGLGSLTGHNQYISKATTVNFRLGDSHDQLWPLTSLFRKKWMERLSSELNVHLEAGHYCTIGDCAWD